MHLLSKTFLITLFVQILSSTAVWAMAGNPQNGEGPSGGSLMLPIVLTLVIAFLFILRPEQNRQKEFQKMLESIEKGDEVTTKGGLIGKVTNVSEKILTLEIAERTRVRISRDFVHKVEKPTV